MGSSNAVTTLPNQALVSLNTSSVYHVGAMLLSTLDRLHVEPQVIQRIFVIGRRVIIFELPNLAYDRLYALASQLNARLALRLEYQLIVVRPAESGCRIIVDLGGPLPQPKPPVHRERTSLVWCEHCSQLMPYGHTHAEG